MLGVVPRVYGDTPKSLATIILCLEAREAGVSTSTALLVCFPSTMQQADTRPHARQPRAVSTQQRYCLPVLCFDQVSVLRLTLWYTTCCRLHHAGRSAPRPRQPLVARAADLPAGAGHVEQPELVRVQIIRHARTHSVGEYHSCMF